MNVVRFHLVAEMPEWLSCDLPDAAPVRLGATVPGTDAEVVPVLCFRGEEAEIDAGRASGREVITPRSSTPGGGSVSSCSFVERLPDLVVPFPKRKVYEAVAETLGPLVVGVL